MAWILGSFSSFFQFWARPGVVFYALAWLMVLLVLGTIAQRYVGLYAAQQVFFYAWILWVGPVPLPGGLFTLGVLVLGLFAKLAVGTIWSRARAGVIVTHIGALLLMVGGVITFFQARDGSITLFEGEKTFFFTDYHARELVIENADTMEVLARFSWAELRPARVLPIFGQEAKIEILQVCRNCGFTGRAQKADDLPRDELKGRARDFALTAIPLELEDEANRAAIMFRLKGTKTDKDGIHLSADFIDQSPWFKAGEQTFNIALRKARYALPFEVELKDFEKDVHPGTDMARRYASDILIHDGGATFRAVIRMNEPLHYRGYTLYQSSYLQDGSREGSVLSVVQNSGRIFPYLASGMMALGLLIHIFVRARGFASSAALRALAVLFVLMMPLAPAWAGETHEDWAAAPFSLRAVGALPILDQGRIKPIDTFARSYLEIFSGRDHIDDRDAVAWLMELLVTPSAAHKRTVFRIQNPVVRDMLDLSARGRNRFSFEEILPQIEKTRPMWEPLFKADLKKLAMPQKQLLELVQNVDLYIELSRSVSLLRRDIDLRGRALADRLGTLAPQVSYLELFAVRQSLQEQVKKLVARAQSERPDKRMSEDEIALLGAVTAMQEMDSHPALNLFRVIPPTDPKGQWQTPWAVWVGGDKGQIAAIKPWQELIQAYRDRDQGRLEAWAEKIAAGGLLVRAQAPIAAEYMFNAWQPFRVSLLFYIAALVFAAVAMGERRRGLTYGLARGSLFLAILLHALGLAFRVYITGRPPVTNLYDSIVFVGLTITVVALLAERRSGDGIFLVLGSLAGVALQSIGLKFDAEGDTLRVLSAVLDTNFWLSTHVTMITMGYGFTILAGLLAHAALVQPLLPRRSANDNALPLRARAIDMAVVALFFTATGTILGGIWADQSWGRFWGWDPKENGALLIVLWIAWALHGRHSGHLTGALLMGALAALHIVVAGAWFGVNLLGVGLHSYGFTQSAMVGFIVFCGADFLLITGLVLANRLCGRSHV